MNDKKLDKLEERLMNKALPIIRQAEGPVEALSLTTVFAKHVIQDICATEGIPVKKNLESAALVLTMESDKDAYLERVSMEKAVQRTLIERGQEMLKAVPTDKEEDEHNTVIKVTEFWAMRDKISEVLHSADCDLPIELIGLIIIPAISMWSGKPVKLFNDTKGKRNEK